MNSLSIVIRNITPHGITDVYSEVILYVLKHWKNMISMKNTDAALSNCILIIMNGNESIVYFVLTILLSEELFGHLDETLTVDCVFDMIRGEFFPFLNTTEWLVATGGC